MTAFNDPFDCRIPFVFDAPEHVAVQHWREISLLAAPGQTEAEREARIMEMIRETQSEEGRKRRSEIQFKSLEKHGIFSLTKHPDNILMWAYYGESHTGVALRLNMSPVILVPLTSSERCVFVEAVYHKEFPKVNYYSDPIQKINDVLGAKALAWKHEEEWRIVYIGAAGRHIKIAPAMIDGVILGVRTSAEHETEIRRWIAERKAKTELLRARIRPGSFELEVVPADI